MSSILVFSRKQNFFWRSRLIFSPVLQETKLDFLEKTAYIFLSSWENSVFFSKILTNLFSLWKMTYFFTLSQRNKTCFLEILTTLFLVISRKRRLFSQENETSFLVFSRKKNFFPGILTYCFPCSWENKAFIVVILKTAYFLGIMTFFLLSWENWASSLKEKKNTFSWDNIQSFLVMLRKTANFLKILTWLIELYQEKILVFWITGLSFLSFSRIQSVLSWDAFNFCFLDKSELISLRSWLIFSLYLEKKCLFPGDLDSSFLFSGGHYSVKIWEY